MAKVYWCKNYSGGRPYKINESRILLWAESDGQNFEKVEDAIAFLNAKRNVTIWAIVEHHKGGSYQGLDA